MTRLLRQLLALLLLAVAGIGVVWSVSARPAPAPDTNALNDAVQIVRTGWPDLDRGALDRVGRPLAVVSPAGEVLYATAPAPPTDALAAVRERTLVAPVVVDETAVALVHLT
ncbi:MAG TPA: hypothetical protein GXZ30_15565, partial [Propionibacterium sp.]|nr:hypothetical protein [Propionibacterium sp.]